MDKSIFKRHELKYLVSAEQRELIESVFERYMIPDEHGESTICNIYYDTSDFRLIRRSLEKPVYKEKLRLRSYGTASGDRNVFLELKKKYKGIVYKRRISLNCDEAQDTLENGERLTENSQIRKSTIFLTITGTFSLLSIFATTERHISEWTIPTSELHLIVTYDGERKILT